MKGILIVLSSLLWQAASGRMHGVVRADTGQEIWFERMPKFEDSDRHTASYLTCKKAHNGRDEWLTTLLPAPQQQQRLGSCATCFCLPSPQNVGCTLTECPRVSRVARRSVPQLTAHTRAAQVKYASAAECIRANGGHAFRRECNDCVCRDDGLVMCTLVACDDDPPKDGDLAELPKRPHPMPPVRPLPDVPEARAKTVYASYDECVKARNGTGTYFDGCNTCWCGGSGAVACTLMLCNGTSAGSTPEYASLDECVKAHGAAHFKVECNSCTCLAGGLVACTKMFCIDPTSTASTPALLRSAGASQRTRQTLAVSRA